MADAITSFNTLSADAVTFIREELLDIAEKNTVFAQFAMQATLPQNSSKTIQFSRYPRLSLPLLPADEGVTPDTVALAVEDVQAVVDQWILIVALTDLSVLTVTHPLVSQTTELLGLVQAELVDREIQKVLNASTSVTFANGRATRAALTSTDTMNAVEVRKLFKLLQRQGARKIGKTYALVVDPEVAQDISVEDQFLTSHALAQATAIFNNQIGDYLGFAVTVSNFIPVVVKKTGGSVVFGGAGGTFASGYAVQVVIEWVNSATGLVEGVQDYLTDTTSSDEKVTVTAPSTAGYVYNIYANRVDTDTPTYADLAYVTQLAASTTVVLADELEIPAASAAGQKPEALPGTGITIHQSYAIGRDSYGTVKLSGDNLRVMMTKMEPTDSDPAAQRRKISVKGSFKALVLNGDWFERFESASAF